MHQNKKKTMCLNLIKKLNLLTAFPSFQFDILYHLLFAAITKGSSQKAAANTEIFLNRVNNGK